MKKNSIVSQYIDKIKEQTLDGKNYIYRGQSQQYNGVKSTAFRRFEKSKIDNPSKLEYLKYHQTLIDDAKNNRYDKGLNEIELLLSLQHYGCATGLIDFSQDFLIALWFACNNSDEDKDGLLFYLYVRTDKFEHISPNGKHSQLQPLLKADKTHYIKPVFKINSRIFAQKGVFVFGYQDINEGFGLESIIISKGDKKSIRKELKKYFYIDEKNLFPDIYGFSYVNNVDHPLTTKTAQDYFEEAYDEPDNKVKIKLYKKAIEIKPDYNAAYNNMGNVYNDLKDYQQAISAYKKAIEIKPDNSAAYNNMGIAYDDLTDYKQAINAYKKAIEIKSDYSDAYYNMGDAYNNLKEFRQAISAYKKAIGINPDHSAAYYNMGNIYYDLKEYQQAINAYKKAIEIDPKLINYSKKRNWNAIKAWINTLPESTEKQEYLEIIAKLEVISHPI